HPSIPRQGRRSAACGITSLNLPDRRSRAMASTRSSGARQHQPSCGGISRPQPLQIGGLGLLRLVIVFAAAPVLSGLAGPSPAAPPKDSPPPAREPAFHKDVLPILARNCLRCHAGKVKRGGLDLSTPEGLLAGGESGPAVVPQQPAASKLYDMVPTGHMPRDRKTKVSAAELATIRLWIERLDAGANTARATAPMNQHDVIPIILRHCTPCHDHRHREGGLDLTTRASMLRGGKSGPALVPGQPEKSLILRKVVAKQMPPLGVFDAGVTRPPDPDVEKLKQWVAQGAPEKE